MRLVAAAAAAITAACAGTATQRTFAGAPTITSGSCPELMAQGRITRSILQLRGETARLTLGEGVVQLTGQIDASGHITASRTPPATGQNKFDMVFEGKLEPHATDRKGTVTGAFATPRCRASLHLDPV